MKAAPASSAFTLHISEHCLPMRFLHWIVFHSTALTCQLLVLPKLSLAVKTVQIDVVVMSFLLFQIRNRNENTCIVSSVSIKFRKVFLLCNYVVRITP